MRKRVTSVESPALVLTEVEDVHGMHCVAPEAAKLCAYCALQMHDDEVPS